MCTEHVTHWQITSQVKTLFSIKKRKKKKENTNAKTLPRNAIQMLLNLHTLVLCIITFFFFFFEGSVSLLILKKNLLYFKMFCFLGYRKYRGCLVCDFKQPFSVFKQHFTHFNAFFHSHVFSQIFSNNNFSFWTHVPNGPIEFKIIQEKEFSFPSYLLDRKKLY